MDSKALFRLCSTTKELEEARNKIILGTIREEHHDSSRPAIRCTPGAAHLADALTKDNHVIAAKLKKALASGGHSNDSLPYSVVSDLPLAVPSIRNDYILIQDTTIQDPPGLVDQHDAEN